MFGIGSTELLVILVVALIVLGPKSLANVSRMLGKAMGEFRRVSTDFQRTLNAEASAEEEERRVKTSKAPTAASNAAPEPAPEAKPAAAATAAQPAPATATTIDVPPAQATATTIDVPPAQATASAPATDGVPAPPPGSPLAEALAKTSAEARTGAVAASTAPENDADEQAGTIAHGGKV